VYAVIAHGGKQYRVAPGDVVRLELMAGSAGDRIELGDVRLLEREGELRFGQDLAAARVVATVLRQGKSAKVIVFKKKRRKQYRRTRGHRQHFTEVRIDSIG
jgi:large subunit ribosomal protein L21